MKVLSDGGYVINDRLDIAGTGQLKRGRPFKTASLSLFWTSIRPWPPLIYLLPLLLR